MASRFWVGGTGNWDAATTTHWAATSGGAGGASVPGIGDTVTFDGNSGAPIATITATANCAGLTVGPGASITGSAALNVAGSCIFDTAGNWTYTGTLTLSVGGAFFPGSFTLNCPIVVTGAVVQQPTGYSSTSTLTLSGSGTYNTNGTPFVQFSSFAMSGASCSITGNSTTFILNGAGAAWNVTAGTVSMASATVRMAGSANQTFAGNGGSYGTLDMRLSAAATLSVTGANTFGTIAVLASGSNAQNLKFTAGTTTTLTTLTVTGFTLANQLGLASITGATHTLSKSSGSVVVDYLSITNSIATGGATWLARDSTDNGGNSGWTFSATRYLVATGTWDASSTTCWSATSGGAAGASAPTSLDPVVFNSASGAVTCTVASGAVCASLTCTGFTGALAGSAQLGVYGNVVLAAGMTMGATALLAIRGVCALTSAGKAPNFAALVAGAAVTLQDDLTTFYITFDTTGTASFNANNHNVTARYVDNSRGHVTGSANLTMGSGTWTMTDAVGSGSVGFIAKVAEGVVTGGTSTLKLVNSDETDLQGVTIYNLWVDDTNTATNLYLLTSGTVNNLKLNAANQVILRINAGDTLNLSSLTVVGGDPSHLATITRIGGSGFGTLSSAAAVGASYLNLSHCHATGGGVFTATDSTDGGDNTGWIFAVSPDPATNGLFMLTDNFFAP